MSKRNVTSRRGIVLVVMAVLIFALFGVAAMVIDLGIFRLTRVQMNSATESAALEGLRYKDTQSDFVRRVRASQLVVRIFDINQDISPGNFEASIGAGPVTALANGTGDLNVNAALQSGVSDPADPANASGPSEGRLWKRRKEVLGNPIWLELNNADNDFYGDLVSGDYDENAAHVDYLPGDPYRRPDFNATPNGDAFLARMRRTRAGVTPRDREDGVSSSGPPIPYLFATASTVQTGPSGFNPRTQGMTVRATAIAQERRTMQAGPLGYSDSDGTIEGVAAISLSRAFWNGLGTNGSDTISFLPSGQINGAGAGPNIGHCYRSTFLAGAITPGATSLVVFMNAGFPVTDTPFVVRVGAEQIRVTGVAATTWTIQRGYDGTTPASHPAAERVTLSAPSWVGLPLIPNESAVAPPLGSLDGSAGVFLVPLYNQVTFGAFPPIDVVVGFGRVRIAAGVVPGQFVVTRLASEVSPRNASSAFPRSWVDALEAALGGSLSSDDVDLLLAQNDAVADSSLAAALVRAYGR